MEPMWVTLFDGTELSELCIVITSQILHISDSNNSTTILFLLQSETYFAQLR